MALALPFFRMERLAMVMPTRSASSVTLILRLASITSMLTIVGTAGFSDGEVIFRLDDGGAVEDALSHGGRRRGDDAGEDGHDAHRDGAGVVVVNPLDPRAFMEDDVGHGAAMKPMTSRAQYLMRRLALTAAGEKASPRPT